MRGHISDYLPLLVILTYIQQSKIVDNDFCDVDIIREIIEAQTLL